MGGISKRMSTLRPTDERMNQNPQPISFGKSLESDGCDVQIKVAEVDQLQLSDHMIVRKKDIIAESELTEWLPKNNERLLLNITLCEKCYQFGMNYLVINRVVVTTHYLYRAKTATTHLSLWKIDWVAGAGSSAECNSSFFRKDQNRISWPPTATVTRMTLFTAIPTTAPGWTEIAKRILVMIQMVQVVQCRQISSGSSKLVFQFIIHYLTTELFSAN